MAGSTTGSTDEKATTGWHYPQHITFRPLAHQHVLGGRAANAALYPLELIPEILKGDWGR